MATVNSNILTKIYKSRTVLLEILEQLDYETKDYSGFSINEINTMKQNNQLDMLLEKKNKQTKIYVRYYFEKTIKLSNLQNIVDDLFNLTQTLTKNDVLFIIKEDEINDTLISDLKYIWETDGIFIVVENIKRLQFNILKHKLQPEFKIMDDETQINNLMQKYNITSKTQFPEIARMDPVARVLCLKPGQILHALRASKTAITSDYYRICV
jgi:DNA-directed RNA polymerase subunit H (RpoH/RPB5)